MASATMTNKPCWRRSVSAARRISSKSQLRLIGARRSQVKRLPRARVDAAVNALEKRLNRISEPSLAVHQGRASRRRRRQRAEARLGAAEAISELRRATSDRPYARGPGGGLAVLDRRGRYPRRRPGAL